jgi:protein SCO1/2
MRLERLLCLVLLIAAGFTGCAPAPAEDAAASSPAAHAGNGASLFELTFDLTDQDGQVRHLADFRGAPFVASMIYTNCTSVCPRVTADLKGLEEALPADRRTRFVLFSLDPERDTPAALHAFADTRHLDLGRWTLLAASPDDMRTLAAVLGVRFRPDEEGEIAHSAIIAVVDSWGVIRHRQVGTAGERSALVAAVRDVQ